MREASWLDTDTENVVLIEEPTKPKMSHDERVESCGTRWSHHIDVGSGKYRRTIFYCEDWRRCPGCLERRALKYRARIENLMLDGVGVRYAELSREAADALSHEIGKDKIWRAPGDNIERCFILDGASDMGVLLTQEMSEGLDWITLVSTPQGRRMSGSLGLVAPGGKKDTITIETVVSDASDELIKAAVKYSIDETKDLRPTRENVEPAIRQRLRIYREYLEANGAVCWVRRITVTVPPTIDWGTAGYYVEGE